VTASSNVTPCFAALASAFPRVPLDTYTYSVYTEYGAALDQLEVEPAIVIGL
jgi:hypothetical protein